MGPKEEYLRLKPLPTCSHTRSYWTTKEMDNFQVGVAGGRTLCDSDTCYSLHDIDTTPEESTPPPRSPHQDVLVDLPSSAADRKDAPITTGVLDYFPAAIAEVARLSKKGNDQHNPGQPLHWARGKSTDHADCIARHLVQRGTLDTDGVRHSAKVAWRALALLQEEIEAEAGFVPGGS